MVYYGGDGADGAVRIVWGDGRYFPSTNVDEDYIYTDKVFTLPSVGESDDGKMFFFMNNSDYSKLIIRPSDTDSIWNSGAGYGIELPDKGTYVALRYDHSTTNFDIIQKTGGRIIVEGVKFHLPMNRMFFSEDATNSLLISDEKTGYHTGLVYNEVKVLNESYAKFPPSCYYLVSSTGSDYIRFNNSSDWDIFGNQIGVKTLSGWIYKLNTQSDDIIHFGEDICCTYCLIKSDQYYGIRLCYYVDGYKKINEYKTNAISLDTWTHIALVINGSDVGLYVDGVQVIYDGLWDTVSFGGTLTLGGVNYDFDGYMQDWFLAYNNIFNASPNSGLTDTFSVPTSPMQLVIEDDNIRRR